MKQAYSLISFSSFPSFQDLGECIYDQGGYFVINGSEKVIIAQERLSNNHVYAFRKKQPSKFSWVIETRSQVENSTRPVSTLYMQMYHKGGKGAIEGNQIRSTLPYIRTGTSSSTDVELAACNSLSTHCSSHQFALLCLLLACLKTLASQMCRASFCFERWGMSPIGTLLSM